MLESLENLLDDVADPEYEVEYGVRQAVPVRYVLRQTLTPGFAERCPDTEARQQGDICHQQAAAKQTDMAVIALQVRRSSSIAMPELPHVLTPAHSGPKRYDYVPERDDWVYLRDGRSLNELLNQELSNVFGQNVDLGLAEVSTQVS